MPAIEYFDEDRHAERNGYGDDEEDDLWDMPPAYTYGEIMDMAATMELTDAQQEELYNAAVNDLVARLTIGKPRNDAARQTLEYMSAQPESVLARAA